MSIAEAQAGDRRHEREEDDKAMDKIREELKQQARKEAEERQLEAGKEALKRALGSGEYTLGQARRMGVDVEDEKSGFKCKTQAGWLPTEHEFEVEEDGDKENGVGIARYPKFGKCIHCFRTYAECMALGFAEMGGPILCNARAQQRRDAKAAAAARPYARKYEKKKF